MKKARFSNEQIVKILREANINTVAEASKRYGVSEGSIYVWRRRFADMTVNEIRQLRALESENSRLKKLLAERDLEIEIMKEIAAKKW